MVSFNNNITNNNNLFVNKKKIQTDGFNSQLSFILLLKVIICRSTRIRNGNVYGVSCELIVDGFLNCVCFFKFLNSIKNVITIKIDLAGIHSKPTL